MANIIRSRHLGMPLLAGLAIFLISFAVMSNWRIPAGTEAEFEIENFPSKVRGSFEFKDSKITFDPDHPADGKMEVSLDVRSIKTGIGMRDKHLRSDDFFAAESYPLMKFQSTKVSKSEGAYLVVGDLTIKDVTKSVSIPFHFSKLPNGNGLFTGDLTINRLDYHVGKKKKGMGDDVKISLKVPVEPAK